MKLLKRVIGWLRPERPESAEDLEAAQEGSRIRERMETTRLSTLSGSGAENYQTGRGDRSQ
jgi:hypothetical protein